MRSMQFCRCFFAALVIMLVPLSPSHAAVVTLDCASESASSDTDSLAAVDVDTRGEQIGVWVQSTSLEPQSFTFKATGLREGNYDFYVNYGGFAEKIIENIRSAGGVKPQTTIEPGAVFRNKPSSELNMGVDLTIPGTVADPVSMRCLKSVQARLQDACDRLEENSPGQAKRLQKTLQQAVDWVRSGIEQDQTYRSAQIVLAPAGTDPEPMVWAMRITAEDTVRTMHRSCSLLQQARDRMYDVLEDPNLRHAAVAALTPVDFSASYQIKSGRPHVDAKLVNNCDIPISGYISMGLPKNWKTTAGTLTFDPLESGKSFDLSFDLVPPTSDATPPNTVPIAANVTITQEFDPSLFSTGEDDPPNPEPGAVVLTAKLKLKIIARKEAGTPAP